MYSVFYEIGEYIIMEVFTGTLYEYYLRKKDDEFDIFHFNFGSDKSFNKEELEALNENHYFEE